MTDFKYDYSVPENINTNEFKHDLKNQIKNAFLEKKLYKGYNEVLNQIKLHRSLVLYMCGPLDPAYDVALKNLLEKLKLSYEIIFLSNKFVSIVHESIHDVNVRNKTQSSRRYFNTRLFAIVK